MELTFRHTAIHPRLRGYIDRIYVLECDRRIPRPDLKMIVPNGCVRLMLPFRNSLSAQREGRCKIAGTHRLALVGVCDLPFTVDVLSDAPSGIIGIEFSPGGAYRFFNVKQCELKNQVLQLEDVWGKLARHLEERAGHAPGAEEKIRLLQEVLAGMLRDDRDNVFDYCIDRINTSAGRVSIRELEAETGYGSRWLNMKFAEKLGVSPKGLCAITRFQAVFQALANHPHTILDNRQFYHLYYDQAHFIREFKRFTGWPPSRFESSAGDFGKMFYRS
ncbi:AraC family transcriptional regulator [Chitinophaga lutea]|uniref:AraC family transcriptional regulator n=1 Tax=Chitinophaga lutea TaxID=2488634 RepID=A0A3N4Q8N5_9BACT|nr:AraC family transcriptional regulator [Chitinophaga lutea]RPE08074.1 AraC family transcriptional regulator [Chitinophaga lutea]